MCRKIIKEGTKLLTLKVLHQMLKRTSGLIETLHRLAPIQMSGARASRSAQEVAVSMLIWPEALVRSTQRRSATEVIISLLYSRNCLMAVIVDSYHSLLRRLSRRVKAHMESTA